MKEAHGYAIEGDKGHWWAECPICETEYEWEGHFDSSIIETCKCGTQYQVIKVWLDDDTYMD